METILIATDFSSAARNATIYGFELARSIKAKVILFTSYHLPTSFPENTVNLSPKELERNSYRLLLQEAETLDPRRTVALATESKEGQSTEAIIAAAAENNVSHIVVGMKERGKQVRKFFGSTVTDLCKKSGIPVIVVPAEAAFARPAAIALASDITSKEDAHILEPIKNLAEYFASKVFVVRVINKSMDEEVEREMRAERLEWFLTDIHPSFEFIKAENVARGLNSFVTDHAIDMVVVIPHEHTLFERLFVRSVTKDLIFNCKVPLLILPHIKKEDNLELRLEKKVSDSVYSIE